MSYDFVFQCTAEVPYTYEIFIEAMKRENVQPGFSAIRIEHDMVHGVCDNCGHPEIQEFMVLDTNKDYIPWKG